jgi:hypothetical protein
MFGKNEKKDQPPEDNYISGADKCKYLGVVLTINGSSNEEINNRVNKGTNIVRSLNSTSRDKSLRKITKKRIYKTMVQSLMTYGAEVWAVSGKERKKLLGTEMDCLPKKPQENKIRQNTE